MTMPGSFSTIFGSAEKLLLAKAQKAWKNLLETTAAASQPTGTDSRTEVTAASAFITLIDPEAQEKLRTIQRDSETLLQKLSSGAETNKETAMRKAEDAKRRLKSLKMQAQMAAASGDTKAAARIAREVAQVARELGQAVKIYGGSGADAAAAAISGISATTPQTMAGDSSNDAETPASGTGMMASGTVADTNDGKTDSGQQQSAKDDQRQPVADDPPADNADEPQTIIIDTLAKPGTDLNSTTQTPDPEIERKRTTLVKDGMERKAATEFYSDARGTMAQLRAILERMKKLALREGAVGMAVQMDLASRDMAEGERLLAEAASPGIVVLPSGSLVQVSA